MNTKVQGSKSQVMVNCDELILLNDAVGDAILYYEQLLRRHGVSPALTDDYVATVADYEVLQERLGGVLELHGEMRGGGPIAQREKANG